MTIEETPVQTALAVARPIPDLAADEFHLFQVLVLREIRNSPGREKSRHAG